MDATKNPVGYLFQMTCDTGNGKHLTVSGNFEKGADAPSMNLEIDKLNIVFDRLRAQHELPLIQERLDGSRDQLLQLEDDLTNYQKQHPTNNKGDQSHVNKMNSVIAQAKVAIAKGEIALLEAQKKAA